MSDRSLYPVGSDFDADVRIPVGDVTLEGHLRLVAGATGVVVFSHGSGSSRRSPRNIFVAEQLNAAGMGTLLIDLLTSQEERDRANVFDIGLLTGRLTGATDWLVHHHGTSTSSVGYFGASTGAASALCAAATAGDRIAAVVSRGGRVDLAGTALSEVTAPTLLIVGGADTVVLELNRLALAELPSSSRLEIVEGAGHLFEEAGTLAHVADLACDWFRRFLVLSDHDGKPIADA
jgi:putative phosphoribosyl transferase